MGLETLIDYILSEQRFRKESSCNRITNIIELSNNDKGGGTKCKTEGSTCS